ncbi:sugar ABC transporter ATP-binding protein [Pelagibius litoralis]|uniref:Sugar ABC transporter ATP-binding protein n=1 Tax=Pelagibius litoralis TaxID=374515 RepID=A0A967EYC9_9PROT|nr:sugar ABC transporter ATP-binding protein [Pelagibius litoralis]NIA69685.1 sugar ABC transporter ATP-binding protein [Pelagibius litoralis]
MISQDNSYVLQDLTRRFPGVLAVDNVNLEVKQGEIHGIIGRNGAGKSVLVNMVAGILAPSAGRVVVKDGFLSPDHSSPIIAHRLGISLIPQEPTFARQLSVVDNMFMGRNITGPANLIRPRQMARAIEGICERLTVKARPNQPIGELPIESQQMLAFGKAVYIDRAKVILLDEITASLTQERKDMLLNLLQTTTRQQPDLSFTLISHHISEVLEFTDRVTVMRDGARVATIDTPGSSKEELAGWIVGDAPKVRIDVPKPRARTKAPILRAEGLSAAPHLKDFDLEIHAGEIVGFAGLEGSGKDAAIEMLFGLRHPSSGTIELNGTAVELQDPLKALSSGIAFLPKHREAQAVIHTRSVEENTLISCYRQFSNRLGLIARSRARAVVEKRSADLRVKTPSIHAVIDNLSGGNKQKVMINRLALTAPQLFLLNEPTRGVDISAKPSLLKVIREELADKSAVIMISESEEELVEVCDRVMVFFKGKVERVIERGEAEFDVGEIYRQVQGVRQ